MPNLASLHAEPLSVPLVDPFVIATGRVDTTRSVLVTAVVESNGQRFTGLGEAACLPPVTKEDQPDALAALLPAAPQLAGLDLAQLDAALDAAFPELPVARAGAEMAILDALAKAQQVPLYTLLSGGKVAPGAAAEVVTDITIPILPPARMAELAQQWWAKGFRSFKIKVGKSLADDRAALAAIAKVTPAARFRLDANCGFTAAQALAFLESARELGLLVECFEQPCGTDDLAGMAEVAAKSEVPVIADESVKRLEDLARIRDARAADGVNLKIAKSGGLRHAYAIGRAAKDAGMPLMVGGMVETRLGMTAAAHLAASLGGAEFPDLDTAWLLASDPFVGGYRESGPRYLLGSEPGLGIARQA